jgi:hypothetical protein
VEKKQLELKYPEKMGVTLLHVAAVAVYKKNFKLNLPKAKSTFTAC